MDRLAELRTRIAETGPALLGYSGGVDSALLAVAAREALPAGEFLAVIGRSASYPTVQYQAALAIARQFDIPLLELSTAELDDPHYRANAPDRCYHCKKELWARLSRVAAERDFRTILDGTNADDLGEHRPGLRAAAERAIVSPLAELGWTKLMVRAAARELGLPTWDAPASPCLSSRIQYGLEVTPERLAQVEAAEAMLRAAGISGDLRVRHRGDRATVEVGPGMLARMQADWPILEARLLALGFASATLDPRGYRRGGLLPELPVLQG